MHSVIAIDLGSNFMQSTKDAVLGLLIGGLEKALEEFIGVVGF